jgi:type IV pilus assembly protein PilC
MKYYYRAVTQYGKQIRGFIEAKDSKEAARYLKKHQLVPITIALPSTFSIQKMFPFLSHASTKDLIFFTRQLSSMLTAGLTLMQGLTIMKEQVRTSQMSDIVENIVTSVENGNTLSTTLERYPQVFPPIYIALIKTGEGSGLLDKILLRLADNLEKQQLLKQTVQNALLYPIIVVVMMIVVTIIMMLFVIPQLDTLYKNLNVELPLQTRIVVQLSDFVQMGWPVLVVLVFGGPFFIRAWYRKKQGRRMIDSFLLKLPLFGTLLGQTMIAEFTRTLGLLVGSGSLVVDSLLKSANVVNNIYYQEAIVLVARRVEKGVTVSDSLSGTPLGQPFLVQMTRIGEQTGKLDESLIKASEYYEREVSQTVKTLTTLLEPFIMVILALGVGFLIFAIITPIYNLLSAIN